MKVLFFVGIPFSLTVILTMASISQPSDMVGKPGRGHSTSES